MGPVNYNWIQINGDNWSAGRIDIRGNTVSAYGDEVALPLMHSEDWHKLSEWLDNFTSEEPQTLDQILETYYSEGNAAIRWFNRDA